MTSYPRPHYPQVSIPAQPNGSRGGVSFPDAYSFEVTPPPYSETSTDDYPNPWDNESLVVSGTPTRLRTRSTIGHAESRPISGDSYIAFPEPQLYRSSSAGSRPQHRRGVRSESDAAALGMHPVLSFPSTASVVTAASSHRQDNDSDGYEVTLREGDDLSQELSNLSLDSEEALRRFQEGKLSEENQVWHRLVPEEARDALGEKEVRRQSVIFEVFKAEREYVSDLEAVQEVFIRGLHEASPPIIPAERLPAFLHDVFGNFTAILAHHQRMLGALFARQREQHPLVQSITDIVLDTVLLDAFRMDYETYIKHYPLSESHHRKELKSNSAYQAFLSSVSSDPRIRKRDLITFLSRPVTRLPRLNLLLETVLKSTDKEHDHPDLETLPLVLGILGDFLKSTQPGIEAAESKVKFWGLCESLVFQKGEVIDMDLYDESRTVVYSGPVSRLNSSSDWIDLTASLLDNFFILTQDVKNSNGTEKRHLMSRPLHLSYLRLGSFTSPPFLKKEKPEDASLLDSLRSSYTVPVYPFTIYHASSKSSRRYTLYVNSEAIRKKWLAAFTDALGVQHARQDATMWFYQETLTERFFRVPLLPTSGGAAVRLPGRITSAAPFSSDGRRFLAVGCAAGIYVSARGREDWREIFTFSNPTAMAAIQTVGKRVYNKLIVHHDTSLYAFSLDAIAKVTLGIAEPRAIEASLERVASEDSTVSFFKCVEVGERVIIIYGSKRRLQMSMNLHAVEVVPGATARLTSPSRKPKPSVHSFRPFSDPAYIPRDAYDISPLIKTVGVCGKDGIIILDPLNLAKSSVAIVPDLSDANSNHRIGTLKTRLDGAKPLGLVRIASNELLVVYDTLGCYITRRGIPSRSAGFIKWESPATSFANRGNLLLLFSSHFVEIRDLSTGRVVQVIEGPDIRLLHSRAPTHGEEDTILVAMKGTKGDKNGLCEKIVELTETSEISSQPAMPVAPSMWDEWDM